ncbi:hypothetical protein N7533_008386 [Penicillium manginii]|uniref:uncharacterized protein n=1 Tax=Penicillium manginii TaxID=203109 RepID=UPI002548A3B0|nr:uncharacterized protein N7533_008386 [Penicillium manginii]KAJ5751358.1 hypothetical protein N7533_008386 [Penicillium manginii]
MSAQPDEILHTLLDTFAPGLSWIVRLLSEVMGVNALSYFLPLAALPMISTFILPWIWGFLEPLVFLVVSSAEIKHRNNLYPQVTRWMSRVQFYSLSGSTVIGTTDAFGYLWDSNKDAVEFVETNEAAYRGKLIKFRITPGQNHVHFFRHKGHLFALFRDPPRNPGDAFSRISENILIYYPFWNKRRFEDLVETIQKFDVDSRRGKIRVLCAHQEKQNASWQRMCDEWPRSFESMALRGTMKQDIINDIQNFLSEEVFDFYKKRGIPHRRGYLFYGPPGTGKSSFCRVIATQFELPIYIINLAIVDSYGLQELFRTLPALPERCVVVLEDIDTAGIQRAGNSTSEDKINRQERVNLATVLNVLDGVGAHSGHILVATTNAKPTLDDALLRPGRMDKQYEFLYPDPETIKIYFTFFFQDYCTDTDPSKKSLGQLAVEFSQAASHVLVSPASLQEYFLRCNGDPAVAIQNAKTIKAGQ